MARHPVSARPAISNEVARLRARLADAEEALRAIRSGEVDTMVGTAQEGSQIFTLEGAGHPYRLLIESMNEGALTLTGDKTILYANQCFAQMVKYPLEQIAGSSFRRFLSTADQATLRPHMKRAAQLGSKLQLSLRTGDNSLLPVQLSIRELVKDSFNQVTIGMVVTDLTESRHTEEMLRTLTHRIVQMQEAERGRVATELHDNITQLLCAVLVRSQVLADKLSSREGPAKREAIQLRKMLGETAEEVERIARHLRPSVLEHLGVGAGLRDIITGFAARTGLIIKLTGEPLTERLPADTELALYRILQVALKNVEQHARARHVTVHLAKQGHTILLTIKDDGIGFNAVPSTTQRNGTDGLDLLGMRERANGVGGEFQVISGGRAGTEIKVRLPLPSKTKQITKQTL